MSASEPHIRPADDSDFAHLLDLVRMLPGPTDAPDFWAAVQNLGHPGTGRDTQPANYVFKRLTAITFVNRQPTPGMITRLCESLLFFFSSNNPELWSILNAVTPSESEWGRDNSGRWWADDVTRTAWRLYVRYQSYGDEGWKQKWEFNRSWYEWLPGRSPTS
jgi:hypothetical protein